MTPASDPDQPPKRPPRPDLASSDPYLAYLEGAIAAGEADLRERVRELACLFAVDRALRRGDDEWRISLQEVVEALPSGFRRDPPVRARIRLGSREVMTEGFRSTEWNLVRRIEPDGHDLGEVEVAMEEPRREGGEPFCPEEGCLLASVADRLGEAMGRIQAEEELRRSEAFQRALIRSSPVPLFSIDQEGLVVMWNSAAERVFGWSAEEICGKSLPILEEIDAEEFAEMRRKAAAGESMEGVQVGCRRHDGTPVSVFLSISPVRVPDVAHEPSAVLFAVEDFDDEQGLWKTNRLQARLLASVGQAVVATDLDGRITHWNRAAESIYGWPSTEVLGLDIMDVVPSGQALRESQAIMEVIRAGDDWSGQVEVRHRDGSTFPALVTNSPIHDEHDRIVGVVGVSSNIGRVKELEAQLRQSQKMEALGGLAGGIAHDFNNLLTVIQGHTEIIVQDLPPNSVLKEDMQEIIAATHRATRLTRPLLALSRRQVMEEIFLDLGKALADIEPLLRRLIPSRIDVKVDLGAEPGTLHGDPSQVDQVIMNLVVNAVDAVEGVGEITLAADLCTITAESASINPWDAPPGRYARLKVSDTGVGMAVDVADRIFEPFFTTKAPGQGTGLGLSTVYGIVKQGRGHALVNSSPGNGATFEILWPLVESPDDNGQTAGTTGKAAAIGSAPSGARRESGIATILVVDDDLAVRSVVRRTLERAGYVVLVATNGREAAGMMAEQANDIRIVLSDVVMPLMGGSDLLEHLGETRPDVPVVLTSGHPDRELSEKTRRRAAGFLRKPFGQGELLRVVREALDA
ncbi:PAS domain-containing hybrid sensor histidine kinase/response regulator [soil metagenome]